MTNKDSNTAAPPAGMQATPDEMLSNPELTSQERDVLREYIDNNHLATTPHDHEKTLAESKGAIDFDKFTYKGIGFIGNAILSVGLTDLFKNGAGKPVFERMAKKLAPAYGKIRGIDHVQSGAAAESALVTLGLFTGGTLLLAPIKWLEDRKPEIVEWLDDRYNQNHTPTPQELKIQEATHQRLRSEAKPTWGNVLKGRVLGVGAVIAAVFALAGRDQQAANKLTDATMNAIGKSENNVLQAAGKSSRLANILNLSFIETYQSLLAEEVLLHTTKTYKKMHSNKQFESPDNDNEPVPKVMAAETPAPYIYMTERVAPAAEIDGLQPKDRKQSWQERMQAMRDLSNRDLINAGTENETEGFAALQRRQESNAIPTMPGTL